MKIQVEQNQLMWMAGEVHGIPAGIYNIERKEQYERSELSPYDARLMVRCGYAKMLEA